MQDYIKKLEDENQKLQETVGLYQSRYGDIYEILEKEKINTVILTESDMSSVVPISGSLSGMFTSNGNIGVSVGCVIKSADTSSFNWNPQDDSKKLKKEINDLKNIIINQRKPFYKRLFRIIIRRIKRKLK